MLGTGLPRWNSTSPEDGQLTSMFTLDLREAALCGGGVQQPHLNVRVLTCPTSSSTLPSASVPTRSSRIGALSEVPLLPRFAGAKSQRPMPYFYP